MGLCMLQYVRERRGNGSSSSSIVEGGNAEWKQRLSFPLFAFASRLVMVIHVLDLRPSSSSSFFGCLRNAAKKLRL